MYDGCSSSAFRSNADGQDRNGSRNPLDCLRCNSTIKSPIRLQCQHYFCRVCIDGEQCCPVCGRQICCAELAEDKVLNYVVESSREVTETCANCDQTSQPMYFCDICHQPLCSECRIATHTAKIFSTHNIIELEERGRMRNRPFCPQHNEPFILFCLDSKSLMCIECFNSSSLEKRGHFVNIDLAHKICCDKLEKNSMNLRIFQDELREQIELRKRLMDDIEKNGEHTSEEIAQKCDSIILRVNALRNQLLNRVVEERDAKKKMLTAQLNELRTLESPVQINLLSVSIFCSYASKMDMLHCYADLHKSIQQFLSSNGRQLIQKIKFDCNFNIDFAEEFTSLVCKPLGLSSSVFADTENAQGMFLNCGPSPQLSSNSQGHHRSLGRQTAGPSPKAIQADLIIAPCVPTSSKEDSGNESLAETANNGEMKTSTADNSTTIPQLLPSEIVFHVNDLTSQQDNGPVNTKFGGNNEPHNQIVEQRFLEQFQTIALPLSGFAQEVTAISKTLLDLQRDLTQRRCVVSPEELMQKITSCEDAWKRLEMHNKHVENIVNHYLKHLWRKEIERIQRQQLAVREKAREIVQLRSLAKRTLKVGQQLKPFATQMASLISVIDVRRSGSVLPSPMEQICSEITSIEPNSENRVAAIKKEEVSRRMAKLEEEKSQMESMEGLTKRRTLREVRPPTPKQRQSSQFVVEMDRDRGTDLAVRETHSCLSSPCSSKKRQQHIHRRLHRNSDSATSDSVHSPPAGNVMFLDLYETDELPVSPTNREEVEEKSKQEKGMNEQNERKSEDEREEIEESKQEKGVNEQNERKGKLEDEMSSNQKTSASDEKQMEEKKQQTTDEKFSNNTEKDAEVIATQSTLPSISQSKNAVLCAQVVAGKDQDVLQAREKLLEAIREKVKRID